jgi:hypothetical protein
MRFVLWEADGTKTEGDLPDEQPRSLLDLSEEEQDKAVGFHLREVLSRVQVTGASRVSLLGANSHVVRSPCPCIWLF